MPEYETVVLKAFERIPVLAIAQCEEKQREFVILTQIMDSLNDTSFVLILGMAIGKNHKKRVYVINTRICVLFLPYPDFVTGKIKRFEESRAATTCETGNLKSRETGKGPHDMGFIVEKDNHHFGPEFIVSFVEPIDEFC